MKMKIEPIKIDIKNDKRFGWVAFLVDRPDFLKDVENARKQLNCGLPITREIAERQIDDANQVETKKHLDEHPEQRKTAQQLGVILYAQSDTDDFVSHILNKYNKSNNFHHVVLFSILCGIVVDKDLQKEWPRLVVGGDPVKFRTEMPVNAPQIALFFNPEADLDKIPDQIREWMKFNQRLDHRIESWVLSSTRSEIRRDRERYWRRMSGVQPLEIALESLGKSITQYKEAKKILRDGIIKSEKKYNEADRLLKSIIFENEAVKQSLKRYRLMLNGGTEK